MAALLALPLLSALLPRWHVLPEWAGAAAVPASTPTAEPQIAMPAHDTRMGPVTVTPPNAAFREVKRTPRVSPQQPPNLPRTAPPSAASVSASTLPQGLSASTAMKWNDRLPVVWLAGP